ncbi:hypothetical protein BHC56_05085, partial [Snodgrassella alvi]
MQKNYRGSVDFVNSNKSLSALADGKLELASPADRLSAVVINHIIGSLIAMPFYIYYMISIFKFFGTIDPDEADALDKEQLDQFFLNWFNLPLTEIIIGFTFVASIIYTIWQIYWMTKYGQSIGKRLLKIRVIRTNGDNAGFIHNILLREVVYGVIASIVSIMTLGFGTL